MNRRDALLAVLVATLWGVNFVVIDRGMEGIPPLLFLTIRFVTVLGLAIWFVPRPALPWRTVVGVGTFMSLGQFGFLYVSMAAGMPAGLASLVLQAQVVLTIVIAAGVLREVPTTLQVAGVGLGVVGLAVVGLGRGGHVPLGALLLCLAAALSWAVGNVISRASKASGGLSLTVWSALVVPVPALALSLVVDGPSGVRDGLGAFGWEAALSTLYTAAFATITAYGIFHGLLSRNPAPAVVPWVLLVPPIGVVSAWLALGETPSSAELVGGALLVVGALVANGVVRLRRHSVSGSTSSGSVVGLPNR
ncbi:O-acetylserine/cysteine efflux transporter [Nocardioides terrae]|uniref:O-acetylserine/cysteine efflux transporter n=1 Tax=Nocardioides terrae TaxID=574651 RepID=A0A1I1DF18_9ACTN|nr:EamA family transporter [Nocardioides terrae]SFB71658.1 O-acetylserine/cysteine efflux transporter [Nocardioides terrae]